MGRGAERPHRLRSSRASPAARSSQARLLDRLQAGTSVAPRVGGNRVFTLERWGDHDQAVLVVRSATAPGRARTLVDPHRLTGDPTAAIDWYHPSPDGRLIAYGISTGGDERSTLQVLDVDDRRAPPRPHPPHPGRVGGVGARRPGVRSTPAIPEASDPVPRRRRVQGRLRHVFWHRSGDRWTHRPRRVGRPPRQDRLGQRVAVGRRSLDARAPLGRLEPHRRPPRRPQHRRPHRADRGHRGPHRARGRRRPGHRAHHPRRRPGPGRVGPAGLGVARPLVHDRPRVRRGHRGHRAARPSSLLVLQHPHRGGRSSHRYAHDGTATVRDRAARARLARRPRPPATDRDEAFFSFTSASPGRPTTYRWSADGGADWSRRLGRLERPGRRLDRRRTWSSRSATRRTDGTDDPDVPRAGRRHRARPRHAVHPHRLRRLLHHDGPVLLRRRRRGVRPPAASTPSPASAAAPRRARPGTAPACASTSSNTFDDFVAAADWLVDRGLTSPRPPRHPGRLATAAC